MTLVAKNVNPHPNFTFLSAMNAVLYYYYNVISIGIFTLIINNRLAMSMICLTNSKTRFFLQTFKQKLIFQNRTFFKNESF